jgi:sugar lactone lactonase YvrE
MRLTILSKTAAIGGLIYTLGFSPSISFAGTLYATLATSGQIIQLSANGTPSTFASGLHNPAALAFDNAGDLFEADSNYPNFGTGAVYKFAPDGTRTTIASGMGEPAGIAVDSSGNIYVGDVFDLKIYKFTPGGVKSTFASGVYPLALAFDAAGNLFAADPYPNGQNTIPSTIDEFAPDGSKTVFATGGFFYPIGLAFDSSGNLYTPVDGGDILKFSPAGVQSTFVHNLGAGLYLAFDDQGNLFASDGNAGKVYEITPGGNVTTFVSGLAYPNGLAFSAAPEPGGQILIALGIAALTALRKRR